MKNLDRDFVDIAKLIQEAKYKTIKTVNTELINLYWNIGEYIYKKVEDEDWGKGVVKKLAAYLKENYPNLKGFDERNLWRMRQFYEVYIDCPKLSTLLTVLPWSSHLHIISKTKSIEEKEFYLKMAIKEKYSVRELERQIDSSLFERYMLSSSKNLPKDSESKNSDLREEIFRDNYIFEFLNLKEDHSEKDLRIALIKNLKDFILELGRGFVFLGEEYRIRVGGQDFFIDLLFYHRELSCLVAIELKTGDFKPEYIGKMNFYLEALDRDVKKAHENPSVGIILCKDKNNEVVEYALSRNLSPSLISEYKTKLIQKEILEAKLLELYETS